jgi:putative tricarboxylic transport membrane protein
MLERVVGLVVVAAASAYLTQAWALPWGTTARPGAGFYPTIIGIFACAVGLLMTARTFLAPAPAAPTRERAPRGAARNRAVSTIVLLAAFCLLMSWVGYPLVAFGFVALLLQRLGSRWRAALLTGALSAAVSYYLFAVLLDVPLPRGPW